MSLDLTNFDRYDYNLCLRPDGVTHAGETVTPKPLKKQFLNIPSKVATSKYTQPRYFFLFRSAKLGQLDATSLMAINHLKNFYLLVEGISSEIYSNSINNAATIVDADTQNVQPSPVMFQLSINPIYEYIDNTCAYVQKTLKPHDTAGFTVNARPVGNIGAAAADPTATNLQTIGEHPNTAFQYVTGAAVGTCSFARLASTNKGRDAVGTAANPYTMCDMPVRISKDQKFVLKLGNTGKEIVSASLQCFDKYSEIVEIGNPFGNEIGFKLVSNDLNVDTSAGATKFSLANTTHENYGALSINFSILCVKENKY